MQSIKDQCIALGLERVTDNVFKINKHALCTTTITCNDDGSAVTEMRHTLVAIDTFNTPEAFNEYAKLNLVKDK